MKTMSNSKVTYWPEKARLSRGNEAPEKPCRREKTGVRVAKKYECGGLISRTWQTEIKPPEGAACEVFVNGKPVAKPNRMFWDAEYCEFCADDYYLPKNA